MKGKYLLAFMVVGILLLTVMCLGVTYNKYDEVTSQVIMDEGITCTINGKAVADGDVVTVNPNFGKLKICVDSQYELPIGVAGIWKSDKETITASSTDSSIVKSGEIKAMFGHGSYDGTLRVFFTDDDGCLADIVLTFKISDGLMVRSQGISITDGAQFTFSGDSTINVTTADGQKHNIKYSGSWSNDCGMSSGASGNEYGESATINILDTMYFDPGYGTMEITI